MLVELADLGKTYDGRDWALRGVNLTIAPGTILGLIGPNGAGKSTALRMVATVMEPTEGGVRYDGAPIDTPERKLEIRRRIGFLGDGNPLYRNMTPAEYLRFFGQCYRLEGAALERSIEDVLETFRLAPKRDTPNGGLSKGMRQRLLIGRCMLHQPSLLILDEPADGLDPRGRSDLRAILADIRSTGVTVIISSHILRELDDLCDQIAILQRGRMVVSGPVDEIIERYEVSRFVYELRVLSGAETARPILARRHALVEHEGTVDGLYAFTVQVRGGDRDMAHLLRELVSAGVEVVTASRVRSRLEDVYNRLSEDQVN